MPKNRLIFLVLIFATLASAGELSFSIGGKATRFAEDRVGHLLISSDCAAKRDCQAKHALSSASFRGVVRRRGGANPGAVMCATKLGGEVVIGTDKEGNQNSFCRFEDGSMVSCGSLTYYGRKNDLRKAE